MDKLNNSDNKEEREIVKLKEEKIKEYNKKRDDSLERKMRELNIMPTVVNNTPVASTSSGSKPKKLKKADMLRNKFEELSNQEEPTDQKEFTK